MQFKSLPTQAPINIRADAYGRAALALSHLAAMTTRCELDIAYGAEAAQRLDIYLPDSKDVKGLPVFLSFHGGGHTHGYKEWMGLNAPAIVAFPAIYIAVEYRLAPGSRPPLTQVPLQLEDGLTALKWAYENVRRYGGDPDRIHIGGHSAGAVIASLMALREDLYPKYALPQGVVKSCFTCSGTYDVRDPVVYGGSVATDSKDRLDPHLAREISPISHVANRRMPFFVSWAQNDNERAKATGPAFVLALRERPGLARGYMFELFDHFWIHIDQQRPDNLVTQTLRAWMKGEF